MSFLALRSFNNPEAAARELAPSAGFVYFGPGSVVLNDENTVLIGYASWNG